MKQKAITNFFKNTKKIIPQSVAISAIDTISPIAEIHEISPEYDVSATLPTFQYTMMFDGCSKGNPGPAGAGAVIYLNGSEIWSRAIYVGEHETNNMAEYTGLLLGLNEVVRRKIRVITVKGDSEVVIKQMLGKYKVKSENLLDIYTQAKDLEKHFDKIDYEHVYRHLNIRADALSNEGLAKVRTVK